MSRPILVLDSGSEPEDTKSPHLRLLCPITRTQGTSGQPILVLDSDSEDEKPTVPETGPANLNITLTRITKTDTDDIKPHSMQLIKMEVFVPTMEFLRHERRIKQEDYKKLDKMKNPKVKKPANLILNPDTLRARFQALGPSALDLYPITLDKGSQDLMVSRYFMSSKYGGSSQATIPNISKRHKEEHGFDDFMYLHPFYQPVAPQVPGACGLVFGTHTSIGSEWPTLQRVFTRIDSNVWQYMGMYRLSSSPSLTKREWLDQEPKVRKTWGREICKQGWGSHVRERVFARKRLGREPTAREIEELAEEGSKKDSVTPDDIMAAFSNGEEELGIWLMECVGYDNDFQLELCQKFPLWVPPPRKAKGSGKSSSAKKTKSAGLKRKRELREESLDFDSGSDDERKFDVKTGKRGKFDLDDLSQDEDEGPAYTPRGTRSRPNYI